MGLSHKIKNDSSIKKKKWGRRDFLNLGIRLTIKDTVSNFHLKIFHNEIDLFKGAYKNYFLKSNLIHRNLEKKEK